MRSTLLAAVVATAALFGCHDATPSGPDTPALARGGEAGPALGANKVAICHTAGRADDPKFHEITVGESAVADHLGDHGDYLATPRTPCPPLPVVNNVRVCKAVATGMPAGRTFVFDVNGEPVTLAGGACADRTFRVGTPVTIRETVPAGTVLDAIAVTPTEAGGGDVATATATVVAGIDVAAVTFTNRALVGDLQLCKAIDPNGLTFGQPWLFEVSPSGYVSRFVSVIGGMQGSPCTMIGPFAVGTTVAIFEELSLSPSSFGIYVTGIDVQPADRLVPGTLDLGARRVRVTIGEGTTRVMYTNARPLGQVRICKRSPSTLTGNVRFFLRDPVWSDGTVTVNVPANGCTDVRSVWIFPGVPINSGLWIFEQPQAGHRVGSITVEPADRVTLPPNLNEGSVAVRVLEGLTVVTYENVQATP